jgi:DNA processing protein
MFPELVIVSGFAYGVDICAHKSALNSGLSTIAVLGNGIDMVYPALHSKYVDQIVESGAFVSEFPCQTKPEPGNFISRNRIIAGLADASIIVESGLKGGALFTAEMANSYNRDVLAFPGRVTDKYALGCNTLIKQNKAALIESAKDLVDYLRWDPMEKSKPVQQVLFAELKEEEKLLFEIIKDKGTLDLDSLSMHAGRPVSKVAATLLTLEFNGIVKSLPGKMYKLA